MRTSERLDYLHQCWTRNVPVMARCYISDNPVSRRNDSAKRGDWGHIEDYADGWFWVSFEGREAIACGPEELAWEPQAL